MPFSEEFYLATYPDIASAYANQEITDLRQHFVEFGYFEGRAGSMPDVDEELYATLYPDVSGAIKRGDVESGTTHYIQAGAAEGRIPSEAARHAIEYWQSILREDAKPV